MIESYLTNSLKYLKKLILKSQTVLQHTNVF